MLKLAKLKLLKLHIRYEEVQEALMKNFRFTTINFIIIGALCKTQSDIPRLIEVLRIVINNDWMPNKIGVHIFDGVVRFNDTDDLKICIQVATASMLVYWIVEAYYFYKAGT